MESRFHVGECIVGKKLLGEAEKIRPLCSDTILCQFNYVIDNRHHGGVAFCQIDIPAVNVDVTKLKERFDQVYPQTELKVSDQKYDRIYGKHVYCECDCKAEVEEIKSKRGFFRGIFHGKPAWGFVSKDRVSTGVYKPTQRVIHKSINIQ